MAVKTSIKDGSLKEIFFVAFPMMASASCDAIMIFTDRVFLSKVSSVQMAAAMGGGISVFMLMSFFIGLIGYSTALIGHYLGASKKQYCSRVVTQTLLIAFCASPMIFLLKPLVYMLFNLMGVPEQQVVFQHLYFNILLNVAVLGLFKSCFSSFFAGIGRTKVVLLSTVIAMTVNIFVNYILIFGKFGFPALEIRGAAYGTIIGAFCGVLVFVFAYLKKSNFLEFSVKKSFCVDFEIIRKLFRFGLPVGIELFLTVLAFNLMILIFQSKGLVSATSATILFNWEMLFFIPLTGIEVAVISLVGRYMGKRTPDIAQKVTFSALRFCIFYAVCIFVLFFLYPNFLVDFFKPHSLDGNFVNIRDLSVFMLRIASFFIFAQALFVVFMGSLRGAGDTFWAMLCGIGRHWVTVFVLFLMLQTFEFSIRISWVVVVMVTFIFTLVLYLRYKQGKWKTIEVVSVEKDGLSIFHEDSLELRDL